MSYIVLFLLFLMYLTIFVCLIVSIVGPLEWLDYLYVLSYIKLAVTLIKYVPQVGTLFHTHTHTHTRMHARTHTHTRARAHTHARTHTHTHTHTPLCSVCIVCFVSPMVVKGQTGHKANVCRLHVVLQCVLALLYFRFVCS